MVNFNRQQTNFMNLYGKYGNELKCPNIYCPFDITRKGVFCLAFYFKRKYFVLIDHIISETICLFCFCVLFSNIYPKIKFTAKIWSDQCNFYSKVIFWNFCLRKIYFTFLCRNWIIDVSQQYCENIIKNDQAELVETLPPSNLSYRFLHNLHSFLLWEKRLKYLIF